MLSVYLAAAYSRKNELREYAKDLEKLGIKVTSNWINQEGEEISSGNFDRDVKISYGQRDIDDINSSEAIVFFAEPSDNQPPRGGRHFELGYAYAQHLECIIVGKEEHLFMYQPDFLVVPTWEKALQNLEKAAQLDKELDERTL